MYGITKTRTLDTIRDGETATIDKTDWVVLPSGKKASYSWRDHAAEMAAGMNREANKNGIYDTVYRIKEFT